MNPEAELPVDLTPAMPSADSHRQRDRDDLDTFAQVVADFFRCSALASEHFKQMLLHEPFRELQMRAHQLRTPAEREGQEVTR